MRRGNGDARRERLIVNGVGAAGSSDVRSSLDKVAAQARAEGLPPGLTLDINDDPCSSTSSIGLSGDVVPVYSDSFTRQSPRLNYLRMLSGRMVSNGLEPLEPPPGMDLAPPASVSGVFPEVGDGSQKAGSVGMIFSLWNTMMGSTLLVMPYTFNEAGWLFALLLSMLGACIAQFSCGLILHYAEGMMADPSAEFADLARLHFGALGQYVTFFTGNFVVLGAAIAMHGYMATVLSHLIAFPPDHGGFCTAAAADFIHAAVGASAAALSPAAAAAAAAASGLDGSSLKQLHADSLHAVATLPGGSGGLLGAPPMGALHSPPPPPAPRTPSDHSPCLEPLIHFWKPPNVHVAPPILICAVLLITLPLSNLPSIKLLARLNSVGVLCFMIILGFAYTSAAVAGVDTSHAFTMEQMFKPAKSGVVFGIFSLSFFIHNAVMTIMRGAAKPQNNSRDLVIAYFITWLCYASVGASSNICPPLHNISALGSPDAKNGILSIEQPKEMAPFLVIARLAVLVQSMSVYPVLLFIVRSQIATAFIWKRPYPGPLPTLAISTVQASVTTTFTCLGVDIADVLKFAGAGGGLVCIYGLPALIHFSYSRRQGTLTLSKVVIVVFLLCYGVFCVCMQLIPSGGGASANRTAANHTTSEGAIDVSL